MTIRYKVSPRKNGCVAAFAYDGRKRIGWVGACQSLRRLEVLKAHVDENYRRNKIGTGLYESLARYGCEIGKPLSSWTGQQSQMARGFWSKQIKLGRAIPDERDRDVSVIRCPVPSLAGRRGP